MYFSNMFLTYIYITFVITFICVNLVYWLDYFIEGHRVISYT